MLAGIQKLSLDDRIASSRAVDNSVRVEFYPTQSEFFSFDALEDIAPSSAVPHFAMDSVKEDPTFFRSVDLIDDCRDDLPAEPKKTESWHGFIAV